MAKGEVLKSRPVVRRDDEFGYTWLQPIEADGNRLLYFTSNCFCADGEHLIVSRIRNDGEQMYLLRFQTGEHVQLTGEPDIDIARAYFDKPREQLYYSDGSVIRRVHVRTLHTEDIYAGNGIESLAVTCNGRYLVSSFRHGYAYRDNDGGRREVILSRLFRIDLQTGCFDRILDRSFDIDHIQCHPHDPEFIMYCNKGYFCTHHRIWYTNIAGDRGGPFGPEQPNEHRTHEYFSPDGRHAVYHGKFYTVDEAGKFRNIGHTWGRMKADGSDDAYYRCPVGVEAGHSSMSAAGDIVADGNGTISLMELRESTGEAAFRPIFRHESSMAGNFVHPHPCFGPDGRYIAFATDFAGRDRGNVYLLDLHSMDLR